MRTLGIAAAILLAGASLVQAATPIVTLWLTTSGNQWKLSCVADGNGSNCAGLTAFDISLGGTGGTQILTSTMTAPQFLDLDTDDANYGKMAGFSSEFDNNGTISGGNVLDIIGGQNTGYGDTNDPEKDFLVLQGIGMTAASKYSASNGMLMGSWAYPVELARGTFSGPGTFSCLEQLTLVLIGAPPSYWEADFNHDGKVSFADYLVLEANFGKSGIAAALGDANGDGKVSFADFQVLEGQFGKLGLEGHWTGPGNVAEALFPMPEPASLLLLSVAGLALLRRRRA